VTNNRLQSDVLGAVIKPMVGTDPAGNFIRLADYVGHVGLSFAPDNLLLDLSFEVASDVHAVFCGDRISFATHHTSWANKEQMKRIEARRRYL
jgi:hypothetical protein